MLKKSFCQTKNEFKLLKAFCVGGAFCLVGQALLNRTSLPPAKILVGFVVSGVVLGVAGGLCAAS